MLQIASENYIEIRHTSQKKQARFGLIFYVSGPKQKAPEKGIFLPAWMVRESRLHATTAGMACKGEWLAQRRFGGRLWPRVIEQKRTAKKR